MLASGCTVWPWFALNDVKSYGTASECDICLQGLLLNMTQVYNHLQIILFLLNNVNVASHAPSFAKLPSFSAFIMNILPICRFFGWTYNFSPPRPSPLLYSTHYCFLGCLAQRMLQSSVHWRSAPTYPWKCNSILSLANDQCLEHSCL